MRRFGGPIRTVLNSNSGRTRAFKIRFHDARARPRSNSPQRQADVMWGHSQYYSTARDSRPAGRLAQPGLGRAARDGCGGATASPQHAAPSGDVGGGSDPASPPRQRPCPTARRRAATASPPQQRPCPAARCRAAIASPPQQRPCTAARCRAAPRRREITRTTPTCRALGRPALGGGGGSGGARSAWEPR